MTCINNGVILEAIFRDLWLQISDERDGRSRSLEDLIGVTRKKLIERQEPLPRRIYDYVRQVQLTRNRAAHEMDVTEDDAIESLRMLSDIASWYFLEFLRNDGEGDASTAALENPKLADSHSPLNRTSRLRIGLVLMGIAATAGILWIFLPRLFDEAEELSAPQESDSMSVSLSVAHYRGAEAEYLGEVGINTEPVLIDDDVRLMARFQSAHYCYLIAYNTDGSEQLCFPSSDAERSAPVSELDFPSEDTDYFGLTDGPGVQGFFLVSSETPLPPFRQWKRESGQSTGAPITGTGVWMVKHTSTGPPKLVSLSSSPRAEIRTRAPEPKQLEPLVLYYSNHKSRVTVHCLAFEVRDVADHNE